MSLPLYAFLLALLKVFLRSLGIVYNHLEKARNNDPDSLGEEDYIYCWQIILGLLFITFFTQFM